MNKIRVLPEILANKIAAGEIVERPASVVKELVENALDSGARAIHIAVEAGGRKLVLVRDDGEGMSQDDAILAFEHHATSKIQTVKDLGAIATLGFRGEALPSIASVSHLTLRTRESCDTSPIAGTEVEIQGGTLRSVKPVAWNRGTEVTVRDLFYNVPARRKFLRSHEAELGHITRLATHCALARPEVRFTLRSDGRLLMDASPVATVRDRICQLFGGDYLQNLVELSGRAGDVVVHGFTSLPHEQRTNPYSQFFYVNRRMVRDKVIASAVRQAYRNCLPASAHPVVLLFVDLPLDQVDVNAHPAKTEIRFRQQHEVFDLVRDTVECALIRSRVVPIYEHRGPPAPGLGGTRDVPEGAHPEAPHQDRVPFDLASTEVMLNPFQKAFHYPFVTVTPAPPSLTDGHDRMPLRADMLLGAAPDLTQRPFYSGGVRILGQVHESYVIACDKDGLLIIDQHVAHERILYEKLAQAIERESVETQGLLVPLTVELSPHQLVMLRRLIPELGRNGFKVEPFGGNAVLIRSVPAVAEDCDCRSLLIEILEGLEREERTIDVERIRDRIAVGTACRSAIKVHTPLTIEKMQWLLDELSMTRIPTNCPHGRPIILRFSLYEIERNFGRV